MWSFVSGFYAEGMQLGGEGRKGGLGVRWSLGKGSSMSCAHGSPESVLTAAWTRLLMESAPFLGLDREG